MMSAQNRITFLTMKLDLKTREYKKLCIELEEVKKKEKISEEELFILKDKFQKNHDEIVEINKELKKLKEAVKVKRKDNEYKQESLFQKNNNKIKEKDEKQKLVIKKKSSIITKILEKLRGLLKK